MHMRLQPPEQISLMDKCITKKGAFYETLQNTYQKYKSTCTTILLGDFNANVQCKHANAQTCVRNYTFDPQNPSLNSQQAATRNNRDRLLGFCSANQLKLMNTFFQKQQSKLVTSREKLTRPNAEPYARHHDGYLAYEQMDFVSFQEKW